MKPLKNYFQLFLGLRCHAEYDTFGYVRSEKTVAITITIPRVLNEAVKELAKRRDCSNVSAVIRSVLYKEADVQKYLEMKDEPAKEIHAAEVRSAKYTIRRLRPKK